MANVIKVGGWNEARRILRAGPLRFRRAVDRAVLQEAQLYKREIVQGITTGSPGGKSFEPLSETTLATRRARGMRGTKPLIARGDLRRSISVVKGPFGGAFAGVLRSARGKDGQSLVNVAQVHEFGKTVVVQLTPKARRFLMMVLRQAGIEPTGGGGKGIAVVRIPARPFLRPVFDKLSKDAPARVTRRVGLLLAGDFGLV